MAKCYRKMEELPKSKDCGAKWLRSTDKCIYF